MEFVVRIKAQFVTNNEFCFDKNKNPRIQGDSDFFSCDIFITGENLFTCRTEAVRIVKSFEKALVAENEDVKKQVVSFINTAVKSIQIDQKCDLSMNGKFDGTEISYVQIAADDVINL